MKKSDVLNELKNNFNQQNLFIQNQEKEKEEINNKIFDFQIQIDQSQEINSKTEQELFQLENKFKDQISFFVKNKYDQEFRLKNINFFKSIK